MNVKKVLALGILLLFAASIGAKDLDGKVKVTKKVYASKKTKAKNANGKKVKADTPKAPKAAPKKWKKPEMVGFYGTMEYGFTKYSKPKDRALTDANGNADTVTITKTSPALLIGTSAGLEFSGVRSWGENSEGMARLGVATSFAKKDDAVRGDYFDTGETVATQATLQDIKRFEGLVVGEYELWNGYGLMFKVDSGLGLVIGGMRDLRVYQKSGEDLFYTGQRFVAKKARFTGRIGASLEKHFGKVIVGTGFRIGFSKQEFQTYGIVEQPSAFAASSHQLTYANLGALSARRAITVTPPTFKVRSYEFRISASVEF